MTHSKLRPARRPCAPLSIVVAATAVAALGPFASAASVEFFGYNYGTGTNVFPFEVASPLAEMMFATYAAAGGTTPANITVGSGGIDSILRLYRGETLLSTHDDLNGATNRDAEIRTNLYFGTIRPGSAVGPAISTGSYEMRMGHFSVNNGSFAISIAHSSGNVSLRNPTFNTGQTVSTVVLNGGGRLTLDSGSYSIGISNVEWSSVLTLDGGVTLNGAVNVQNTGTVNHNAAAVVGNYVQIGLAANSFSRYQMTDASATLVTGNISMGFAATAVAEFLQSAGDVSTNGIYMGAAFASDERSTYRITGGTLTATNIYGDGTANNVLDIQGGTVRLPNPTSANTSLVAGQSLLWGSGTLEYTTTSGLVDLRRVFGTSVNLTAEQRLVLRGDPAGWNTPIHVNGGTLDVHQLGPASPINWTSGTIDLSRSAGITIGAGQPFGPLLTLSSGKVLFSSGGFGGTIDTGGSVIVHSGARLAIDALQNAGNLHLVAAGAVVETTLLTNAGTLGGSGLIRGDVANAAAGRIALAAADALSIQGAMINSGQVRLTGGSLTASTSLLNEAGATLTGRGTVAGGPVTNRGAITFSAGVSDLDAALTNETGSKTIITGGATMTAYGAVTNDAGSEFRVSQDARVAFLGTVTGLAAFTGSGTKYFEGGTTGGALMSGGGSSVVEASGSLVAAGIREAGLVVRGSAALAAGSATSRLNALDLDGGTLDLADNRLIIDYADASPAGEIRAAILSGDLFSSGAPTLRRAIGYADNALLGVASFGELPVDATSLLIRWTLLGDANLDGSVNFGDLVRLAQSYNLSGKAWAQGDFNYDGTVNFADLVSLAQNYNTSMPAALISSPSPAFAADWALAQALAPEPTSLVALSLLALVPRRRPL